MWAECGILYREPQALDADGAVLQFEGLRLKLDDPLDRLFPRNRTKAVRSRPNRIWCL